MGREEYKKRETTHECKDHVEVAKDESEVETVFAKTRRGSKVRRMQSNRSLRANATNDTFDQVGESAEELVIDEELAETEVDNIAVGDEVPTTCIMDAPMDLSIPKPEPHKGAKKNPKSDKSHPIQVVVNKLLENF